MGTLSNQIATRENCNGLVSSLYSSNLGKCVTKNDIVTNAAKKLVVLESGINGNKTYSGSYASTKLVKYSDLGYYVSCEYQTTGTGAQSGWPSFSPTIKFYNKVINGTSSGVPTGYKWSISPFTTSSIFTGNSDLGLTNDFFSSLDLSKLTIAASNSTSNSNLTHFKVNDYEGTKSNDGSYFFWDNTSSKAIINNIQSTKKLTIFMTTVPDDSISATPANWNPSYSASSQTINIKSNGAWTAKSGANWLTVSKYSGTGDDTVTLSVTENTSIENSRSSTVTFTKGNVIAQVSVTQAKKDYLSIDTISYSIKPSGSSVTTNITANGDWTASSNQSWLTVNKTSGTENGSITLTVAKNTTSTSRSAEVTIKRGTITKKISVSQAAYSISISPTSVTGLSSSPSSTPITVTANDSWTATSNLSGFVVSPAAGTGNANISLDVTENTSTSNDRSGTITFTCGTATATLSVSQNKKSALEVTPSIWNTSSSAAAKTIEVTANGSWNASSNQSWLTVNKTSGTGNGSVTLSVTANSSTTSSREATVTFTCNGLTATVKVTQAKKDSIKVDTTSWSTSSSAATKTITVTANGSWTATSSNTSWLTVGTTTSNSAVLNVTANSSTTSSRTGKVTFKCGTATAVVTVTQAKKDSIKVDGKASTTWSHVSAGGEYMSFAIESNGSWSAESSATWLTIGTKDGSSGTTSVKLTAAANTAITSREATATFTCGNASATVRVTQNAMVYTLTVDSSTWSPSAVVNSKTVKVHLMVLGLHQKQLVLIGLLLILHLEQVEQNLLHYLSQKIHLLHLEQQQ